MNNRPSTRFTRFDFDARSQAEVSSSLSPASASSPTDLGNADSILGSGSARRSSQTILSRSSDPAHRLRTASDRLPRKLRIVEAAELGVRSWEHLAFIDGSVWDTYERLYQLRLGTVDLPCGGTETLLTVAEKKRRSSSSQMFSNLVLIKTVSGAKVDRKLDLLQQIRHENIITPIEVYRTTEACSVVFEFMAIPLLSIACSPSLNDVRLAAVLAQILNGMAYLEAKGLMHSSLTCSNVLLHPRGVVKIVAQEDCVPNSDRPEQDIRALSSLTMVLLQGYCEDDKSIGIDHPELWSLNVLDFLSQTTSAASTKELQAHSLFRARHGPQDLVGLVVFGCVAARTAINCPPL
ncbi:hypothetical protein T440DRAFT_462000 [Plenodomus tracheiphilus IPT5]|uniref:Protein kinase domain-containing protein n=1 Tax=Plenodomus tracheiphilus IPT5 TaxID=1408161 RepID=A0A6A7AQQ6_9PLEO|nr:hypothetical protein T440DRAFT_462000 [Plenodomus tracheiphilus IPT5]